MEIKFTVFAAGDDVEDIYLIYQAFETSAPGAVVAQGVSNPPQSFPQTLYLTVPNAVPHRVVVWSSSDGVSLDSVFTDFMYDPSFSEVIIRKALELEVGGSDPHDPQDGEVTFPDIDGTGGIEDIASWSGAAQWYPEMRSKSGRLKETEYTINPGNRSFTLAVPDDVFTSPDTVWIVFPPKIKSVSPIINSMRWWPSYKRVVASDTVDATYYGAYVDLVFDATGGTILLPALETVPDGTDIKLYSLNGNQKQLTVRCAVGESVQWNNMNLNDLFIGKTETLILYKRTDNTDPDNPVYFWHVGNDLPGMRLVGTRFSSDSGLLGAEPILQPNAYPLDGRFLLIAEHPRLMWYVNRLPVGYVFSQADRTAAAGALDGFFALSTDGLSIILPDMRGLHERAIPGTRGNDSGRDGTSKAGTVDGSHLMQHGHFVMHSQKVSSGGFPPAPTASSSIATEFDKNSGGGRESMYTVQGAGPADVGLSSEAGDRDENTVKNAGVVRFIYV